MHFRIRRPPLVARESSVRHLRREKGLGKQLGKFNVMDCLLEGVGELVFVGDEVIFSWWSKAYRICASGVASVPEKMRSDGPLGVALHLVHIRPSFDDNEFDHIPTSSLSHLITII
jgi:hypothetical protein